MVLVDTSVWIRALSGRDNCKEPLDRLLADELVLAHELVLGELLIGDMAGRPHFIAQYDQMRYAATVLHGDVVTLVRRQKLYGRGIGWIDAHLVAAALAGGNRFWTADGRLRQIAHDLNIAFHPFESNE